MARAAAFKEEWTQTCKLLKSKGVLDGSSAAERPVPLTLDHDCAEFDHSPPRQRRQCAQAHFARFSRAEVDNGRDRIGSKISRTERDDESDRYLGG
jgi:hypothetical protein